MNMILLQKKFILLISAVLIMLLLSGIALGAEVDEVTLVQGDAYQINNYLIDARLITASGQTASFDVYEREEKIKSSMISVNESFTFDFEDGGEVEVELVKVDSSSGLLDRATIAISISGYSLRDLHTTKKIPYGDDPDFVGVPELEITKEVGAETVNVGESVRITVKAKNVGDDEALDVRFSDSPKRSFALGDTILDDKGPMFIGTGESKTIMIYELKPTEPGTFTLTPTEATFYNKANKRFEAESNTPTITVEGSLQEADVTISHSAESRNVERNSRINMVLNLKNEGNTAAQGLRVDIELPDDIEFVGGDDEVEVIGGNPRIYIESFGQQQEKEITYSVRPKVTGTYSIGAKLFYEYDDGISTSDASKEATVDNINVVEAKYDFLLELPVYVYIVPLLIFGAVGAWIIHRQKQYKF